MGTCHYCGGNCPNKPDNSEYLCDGFAGDIDGLYELRDLRELLAKLKQQADAQAPYFNDRLLTKIEQIEAILQDDGK